MANHKEETKLQNINKVDKLLQSSRNHNSGLY